MWQILQVIFGLLLIAFGIFGVIAPIIPGLILIFAGVSMILNITLRRLWDLFSQKFLS